MSSSAVEIAFEVGPTIRSVGDALNLVKAVAEAGGDALKVQILDADRLVADPTVEVGWRDADGMARRAPLRWVLQQRQLSRAEWVDVGLACHEARIGLMATVDDAKSLRTALLANATALKIMSGDITHLAWIAEVAQAGLPVLVDTGQASLSEMEAAVETIKRQTLPPAVTIVHCPSGYPARLDSIDLTMLRSLAAVFGDDARIGFSDHSPGWAMDVAAVALGAVFIEKTLCPAGTRGVSLPEFGFSLEPDEAGDFVRTLREVSQAMGRRRRVPDDAERAGKYIARRSAHAARDLPAGQILGPDDVDWRRPEVGVPVSNAERLWGRSLYVPVAAGQPILWEDLE